ncbi:hypothetical protein ASPACDRAFT_53249 [Aspergillus aculeatus ATCC 16872]|uniref:Amine oxidase n=1 Tax=Aspergillus aculeatus (strain ATCC 16872 / CBS 172.66 / WB 5094) TaxID=690307 RepID=A0A1L9WQ39_ASPA1|nr:uncharacterized protein ASPACDRAFT_53249 [Aspergillus aculeatus ATCC 16872]OJJ98305.1 hypothetical protein ASPACDRAFT_53249 [Aspergillus aculeatus ATCC 16872]
MYNAASIVQPEKIRFAQILRAHHKTTPIRSKVIDLLEPFKASLLAYLNARRRGSLAPPRRAYIYYHHILKSKACNENPLVLAEASVVNDPWLYGTDRPDVTRRLYQCYMYAVLDDDQEANHYSLPMAFAPIFDAHTVELVEIERLPRGAGAELDQETVPWDAVKPVEYSERLLGKPYFRRDLKPRHITWQKLSFHLGWTVREGPVLHNVFYDGRSLFHRVFRSEMTVPYGDSRAPYRHKQAFDLGDMGFSLTSNTLTLGCDCLSHIAYFDGIRATGTGKPVEMKNVICMHEVDEGIGGKHINVRNGQASTVRTRTLVLQCTATVMNYEHMSTMPIARHTFSPWGTAVASGVLAVNHQHLLNLRIDPALDGTGNTIVYDDVLPVRDDSTVEDPQGCAFRRTTTAITQPGGYELNPAASQTCRIINPSRTNAIIGEPVGYRLHASPCQGLIMGPETFNFRRDELHAVGEFTNQSMNDTGLGGMESTPAVRGEREYRALAHIWHHAHHSSGRCVCCPWSTFIFGSLTVAPDFPVMPVEKMVVSLKPTSFFELIPSNDVPRSSQSLSRSTEHHKVAPVPCEKCAL